MAPVCDAITRKDHLLHVLTELAQFWSSFHRAHLAVVQNDGAAPMDRATACSAVNRKTTTKTHQHSTNYDMVVLQCTVQMIEL